MSSFLFAVSCFRFSILYPKAIDVLGCPGCGGRLRLIATIGYRAVIDKILRTSAGSLWSAGYLGLPGETVEPAPPRHPPWLPGFEVPIDSATEWPG